MQTKRIPFTEENKMLTTEEVASRVVNYLDQKLIETLNVISDKNGVLVYDPTKDPYLIHPSGYHITTGEHMDSLMSMILRQANQIGQHTRRGAANVAIISPYFCKILEHYEKDFFVKMNDSEKNHPSHVGSIYRKGCMDLYVHDMVDGIILGYCGNNDQLGSIDSGLIYSPYVVDTADTGALVMRDTFHKIEKQNYSWDFICDGSDYYRKIKTDQKIYFV